MLKRDGCKDVQSFCATSNGLFDFRIRPFAQFMVQERMLDVLVQRRLERLGVGEFVRESDASNEDLDVVFRRKMAYFKRKKGFSDDKERNKNVKKTHRGSIRGLSHGLADLKVTVPLLVGLNTTAVRVMASGTSNFLCP